MKKVRMLHLWEYNVYHSSYMGKPCCGWKGHRRGEAPLSGAAVTINVTNTSTIKGPDGEL